MFRPALTHIGRDGSSMIRSRMFYTASVPKAGGTRCMICHSSLNSRGSRHCVECLPTFTDVIPSDNQSSDNCLGKPCRSCYVPVPFQFASLYCGQEVFVGSNGLPSSVSHLFVGDMVSVGDVEELSEASHLHGLYPSLCVCC